MHTLLMAVCAAAGFMLQSCVNENDDNCEFPLRLHFSYLYNRENQDLFRDEVSSVSLFLYDTDTGDLVSSTKVPVCDIAESNLYEWKVSPGRYTLVTWGGVETRHQVNSASNISDHLAGLKSYNAEQQREHLWHNIRTDILINGAVTPPYEVDLHKLSNDLTVRIHTGEVCDSKIAITNGLFNQHGRVAALKPTVYLPSASNSAKVATHCYTLLWLDRNDDSNLQVSLADNKIIYDGPLSSLLASDNSKDLDLDDEWELDFNIDEPNQSDTHVKISVNGWLVNEYTVKLR